jgi:hypothetical protein
MIKIFIHGAPAFFTAAECTPVVEAGGVNAGATCEGACVLAPQDGQNTAVVFKVAPQLVQNAITSP